MQRLVTGAGSLLLRGLGPSGLLITRGLGGGVTVIVEVPGRPRHLLIRGGSGRREEGQTERVHCFFVNARLVSVNDQELRAPIEGEVKVCYGTDRFKVTSALPRVGKRFVRVIATLRRSGLGPEE